MRSLQDKYALVTGAASGIGRAIALELGRAGCHCALLDVQEEGLLETEQELRRLGVATLRLPCDLLQEESIDGAVERLLDYWPEIDLLVNCAGVNFYSRSIEMEPEDWQRVLAVNLHAPISICQRLLPVLLKQPEAHIVNVCSLLGLVGFSRFAAYNASKFGLVGYTESLRIEHLRSQLGVSAICPGLVQTPFLDNLSISRGKRIVFAILNRMTTTPEVVAARTVRAIRKNQGTVVITSFAHLASRIKRFFPQLLNLQRLRRRRVPSEANGYNKPITAPRRAA